MTYKKQIFGNTTLCLCAMVFLLGLLGEGITEAATVFDVDVTFTGNPMGDDDGNTQGVDPGSMDQDVIERIFQFFADGVYESTEGVHKIGKVRLFRNGKNKANADVLWESNKACKPEAIRGGISRSSSKLKFCDILVGTTINFLALEEDAGYALAHEWAHYAYALGDEYERVRGNGDILVKPSLLNSPWSATNCVLSSGCTSLDTQWLNFSIARINGGRFQNTLHTEQHELYGVSAWEALATKDSIQSKLSNKGLSKQTRPFYPDLVAVAPSPGNEPSFPDLPGTARSDLDIMWMNDQLGYNIILDRSGSMSGTPIANAKTAAKLLVDLAQDGTTKIGVVAFNSVASVIVPMTDIIDQSSKNTIKVAIDSIFASGGTAIGAGAQRGLSELTSPSLASSSRVAFLLSDGVSGDNALAPIPGYQANQIPIFTFSFGPNADTATLGQMAQATNGRLFQSPTSLAAVSQAFQEANAQGSNATNVVSGSGNLLSSLSFPIQVDSTLDRLIVTVVHPGNPTEALLQIETPNGVRLDPTNVSQSGGETLILFSVENPDPGQWQLVGTGTVDIRFQASGTSEVITYDLSLIPLPDKNIQYSDPIVIIANLSKELPIAGATCNGTVTSPDSTQSIVDFHDDGQMSDELMNDGNYTAIIDYQQNGIFEILVQCDNTAGTAFLTTNGFSDVPGIDGAKIPDPPPSPISENFVRFGTIQVTTTGVVADDHGNTPGSATPVLADNSALVSGKIEVGGDVDMFAVQVPAEHQGELLVRVSGFALGMEPRLRLFGSDGLTLLTEGTLTTNSSERGYLFLKILAQPNTTLFAEVTHLDIQAGTGIYQVSAGSALPIDLESLATEPIPGDLDGDGDVDRDDMNIILAARNSLANGPDDPRDLDGDGRITGLDARKIVPLCTRPRCATQ